MRQNGKGSFGQRHYTAFCFLAVGAALTVNPQPAILPEDVFFGQAGQLRNAEPGIEQR